MRSSVCSLFVCISVLLLARAGNGTTVRNVTAVLGQSITLRCPGNPNAVVRLYIQKDSKVQVFINGFDIDRELPVKPEYKNRTKVNRSDLSMEMSNISISDEGSYKCVIFHNRTHNDQFKILNLKVTAEYNIPNVTAACSEPLTAERSCQLSCSSAGGYPQSGVRWTGLNPNLTGVIHNNSLQDPNSKTWTVHQTISYLCTQPINISCSIGGAVSHITICKTADAGKFPPDSVVISAVIVLLLILFIGLSGYIIRRCLGRRHAVPVDPALGVPLADCHSQPQDS